MGEFWGLDGVNGFAAFNFMLYIAMRYIHSSGATSKTDILAITKFTTIGYDLYNLVDTTLDVQLEFFIS